jgi:hypothetical protein
MPLTAPLRWVAESVVAAGGADLYSLRVPVAPMGMTSSSLLGLAGLGFREDLCAFTDGFR